MLIQLLRKCSHLPTHGGSMKTMLMAPGVGFAPAQCWRYLPQPPLVSFISPSIDLLFYFLHEQRDILNRPMEIRNTPDEHISKLFEAFQTFYLIGIVNKVWGYYLRSQIYIVLISSFIKSRIITLLRARARHPLDFSFVEIWESEGLIKSRCIW